MRILVRPVVRPESEFIRGIRYCSPSCPYLKGEMESVNKHCSLMNKELDFYDWHLAICDDYSDKHKDQI